MFLQVKKIRNKFEVGTKEFLWSNGKEVKKYIYMKI